MARNKHSGMPSDGKKGLTVEVRNGNIDGAIKLLNRKVKSEGLIREIRQREFYEKPSTVRRRKHNDAVVRQRKAEARRFD